MRPSTASRPSYPLRRCSSHRNPCEPLLLYLAATNHVVNAALVVEREEQGHALLVQRPVYFVSNVLTDTKSRYPQTQKLLYAVIMAAKKLQHYFTEHEVSVVTSFPLGEVVRNRDAMGGFPNGQSS